MSIPIVGNVIVPVMLHCSCQKSVDITNPWKAMV